MTINIITTYQKWVWEKRGEHYLVHGDAKAAPVIGTTLRTTDPVPADSRQSFERHVSTPAPERRSRVLRRCFTERSQHKEETQGDIDRRQRTKVLLFCRLRYLSEDWIREATSYVIV